MDCGRRGVESVLLFVSVHPHNSPLGEELLASFPCKVEETETPGSYTPAQILAGLIQSTGTCSTWYSFPLSSLPLTKGLWQNVTVTGLGLTLRRGGLGGERGNLQSGPAQSARS